MPAWTLKMKLVSPMPGQIVTATMQFLQVQGFFPNDNTGYNMSLLIHTRGVHCWGVILFHGMGATNLNFRAPIDNRLVVPILFYVIGMYMYSLYMMSTSMLNQF